MSAPATILLWTDPGKNAAPAPELCCYLLPGEKNPRPAVLVIPGGGYGCVCESTEGEPIARKFNELGFHAFVLHYRVAPHRFPEPQEDVLRAIRLIRARAGAWRVIPDRLAVCGFSAGGHLAASAGTLFDEISADAGDDADLQNARPDAMILCYPVISFARFAHEGSARNLLGGHFPQWKERLSLETRVTEKTPPAFIWHTAEDAAVPWRNSAMMAEALYDKKVPCSLHIFPHGGHGMLLGTGTPDVVQWPEMAKRFLIRSCGFSVPDSPTEF